MKRFFDLLKQKDGMVMVFVLCFLVLLFAIGTSVIVASDPLSANIQQNVYQEQAMLTSISYGDLIKAELAKDGTMKDEADRVIKSDTAAMLTAKNVDRIGSAEIKLEPFAKKNNLTVTIDSKYRGQKYKLKMLFQYTVGEEPEKKISYDFIQYVPNN